MLHTNFVKKIKFLRNLLLCFSLLFFGCTSSIDISYSDLREQTGVDDEMRMVFSMNANQPEDNIETKKIWLVEFSSRTDIEEIVEKRGLIFLYYVLTFCDSSDEAVELFHSHVYVNREKKSGGLNYYYAPISKDIKTDVKNYLALTNKQIPEKNGDICLNFAAGNMAFGKLQTNRIRLNWLRL